MNDWRTRLKDADAARQHDVPAEEIQRIRKSVLAAVRQSASVPVAIWLRPVVIVAALIVIVVAGATALIQTTLRTNPAIIDDRTAPGAAVEQPNAASDRQQLQFATPGGTRIIWVFDPNFEVKGTLP